LGVAAGHAFDLLDIETDPAQRQEIHRGLNALKEKVAQAPAKFQTKLLKDPVLSRLMEGVDQIHRQPASWESLARRGHS
jgi:hypothetical protein